MEKEYIDPQDMRTKFRSKSDLWTRMSVDCKYLLRAYMFSGYSLTILSSMPNSVYEAVVISKKKVSLPYYTPLMIQNMHE